MPHQTRAVTVSRRHIVRSAAVALAAASIAGRTQARQATPEPHGSPVPASWGIQITPEAVRFDEPFIVEVFGLQPDEHVTVRSRFEDARGQVWEASADFIADASVDRFTGTAGYLNVSGAVPVGGSFDVADSMALVWAATIGLSKSAFFPAYTEQATVAITCERATGSITRQVTRSFGERLTTPLDIQQPEGGIVGRYYPPLDDALAPAVIQIGGSEGGLNPGLETTARLLNQDGYAVLSLAYWGLPNLPHAMSRIPLEYFETAVIWLKAQDGIDPGRIGMIGTSRGGEGALLAAAHLPEITSVISISGGGLVFADPWTSPLTPAWTWQGKDIPFVDYDAATDDQQVEAQIPVETINGPILLLSGEDDELWPSAFYSQFAWDRLQRLEHPFPDQLLRYPGCGHAFLEPYQPVSWVVDAIDAVSSLGGTTVGTANAAVASWAAIRQHLASSIGHS